jgi:translocator assembly and maintenance protein 41
MMKYGVISKRILLDDLTTWNNLYVAGRLHKPVQYLKCSSEVEAAIDANKRLAFSVTLSLLPAVFREIDLYLKLASLSYIGDPRMIVGENPRKVVNLVTPIVPIYRELYRDTIARYGQEMGLRLLTPYRAEMDPNSPTNKNILEAKHTVYTQDVARTTRWSVALQFPQTMRKLLMIRGRERMLVYTNSRHAKSQLPILPPSKAAIRTALASIVTRSAGLQSAKGILTVGIIKGAQYIFAKMMKQFNGGLKSVGRRSLVSRKEMCPESSRMF